jgi:hypothetical protein
MGRALLALGLALLALACASCVFVPFVPLRELPAPRRARSAAPMCVSEELAELPQPLRRQQRTKPDRHERMLAQIPVSEKRHERMLVELFSALLQTDDLTLLERDAQAMGVAYLDTNFTMCRPPLLLRQSVRDIMRRYDLAMLPLERKWTRVPGNGSVGVHIA